MSGRARPGRHRQAAPSSHTLPGARRARGPVLALVVAVAALSLSLVDWSANAVSPHFVHLYRTSSRPGRGPAVTTRSTELGVAFTARRAGEIAGVRFYKTAANTGTHTAALWSATGRKLAGATFGRGTRSGWQTVRFHSRVHIAAGRTYVASYHSNHGRYAVRQHTFAHGRTIGNALLSGHRGVYRHGRAGFPTATWHASSYFVDVLFVPAASGTPKSGSPSSHGTTAPSSARPVASPSSAPASPSSAPASPSSAPARSSSAPARSSSAPARSSSAPASPPASSVSGGSAQTSPPAAGVPAGTTLTPAHGTTITQDGATLSGEDITGGVTVDASNVTITDSAIHGSGEFGVSVRSGASVTLSHDRISGFQNGVYGDNYTASHVEVTQLLDDGFKLGSHVTIDSSWCHDMTPESGAHADCAQLQSGEVDVVVSNSWFDAGSGNGSNSALFLAPDLGPSSNGPLTITHNVLGGGNYTLYCVDGNNGEYFVKNITISDNSFLRDSQYGPDEVNVPVTWTGNTWADTGKALAE